MKIKGGARKIQELIEEFGELIEARDILADIWRDVGPYNQGKLSDETIKQMQNYFGFDDSE